MKIDHENPFELENIDWALSLDLPDLSTTIRTAEDKLLDRKKRKQDGFNFTQFVLEDEQELNF